MLEALSFLESQYCGQFLLRIEDTDTKRLVVDAEERLYEDLKWAGLSWDEGPGVGGPYGPYKQSERSQIYKEYADRLVADGRAYRCFCTEYHLNGLKKIAREESRDYLYNKACSHIPAEDSIQRAANGEPHCIRFKSDSETPPVQDLVYGTYKSPVPPEDFIIMKTGGIPTYHFANVVDDHLMKITHVIRGAFHLRFTKGDITVNNKNDFLQKAHMRKSLDQSGDKASVFATLVDSFSNHIAKCEENRDDSGAPHKDLGVRIGPLLRAAQSTESPGTAPGAVVSQSYLKALFDLDGKSYSSPVAHIQRSVYLLWEIPEEEYMERLVDQQAILDRIVVQESVGGETQQHSRKVSELATTLLESLQAIPEGNWTEQNIKDAIGPFIKSIGYVSDEQPVHAWGWKFLRWVISASAAGPALIASMVFLGKEKVLSRVLQASQIAQRMGV
ncbi:hypothetical protein ONZ43_g1896 [Nemania bipapillata]|uniref:Uncharacterized protein n=1 Tax=Nemania bipapillata TaxID=110536 RepID=A0ACC2J2R3_9PEZI|nr:hypothetical protein ONZ43_g1896 [Nemania bipapillata]